MVDKENVIRSFKIKTAEFFHEIDGFTAGEIEEIVLGFVKEKLDAENISSDEIFLGKMALVGSRCRGLENEDSDIDIVLEFESDYLREDSFFDLLHEEEWSIDGHIVDINPITEEKSGSLAEYLVGVEKYLLEKKTKPKLDKLIENAKKPIQDFNIVGNKKELDFEVE